jgi:hypothetical protein
MSRGDPLRHIPRLYGKVHGFQPPRWLSHADAFERLIGACHDATDLGLRPSGGTYNRPLPMLLASRQRVASWTLASTGKRSQRFCKAR